MNSCLTCKWYTNTNVTSCPFVFQAKMYPMIGCETMYIEKK